MLSLDTEKTFSSTEFAFLHAVLKLMDFGPRFLMSITLLYSNPQASLKINGTYLELNAIKRGTKQGCPLSRALFAIAIKPLARLIQEMADYPRNFYWIDSKQGDVVCRLHAIVPFESGILMMALHCILEESGILSGLKVKVNLLGSL